MIRILILPLLALIGLACSKTTDTPPPTPTASFSFTLATGGEVAFLNNSQNATVYSWDFGDGSTKVTDASPRHVYAVNGMYNVALTATGAGGSATSTQIITVSNAPDPKPAVDFSFSETTGVVSFASTTNHTTSLSWDFGDGTAKSNEVNPKHTYSKNQTYTVVLTATGKGGTTTVSKSVEVKAAPLIDPKAIYISKITLTQLGYFSKNAGAYRIFIKRKDNAGYLEIFKSSEAYSLIELDKRYEYADKMPFKLNFPDRAHAISFANNQTGYYADFGDTFESTAYFDGDQSILAYLRKKGFPAKITINDATNYTYKATFDIELKYDF